LSGQGYVGKKGEFWVGLGNSGFWVLWEKTASASGTQALIILIEGCYIEQGQVMMSKKSYVINSKGLVIMLDQSLESCDWPKINYLMRKGYSREEAVAFLPLLASGKIPNIDSIPPNSSSRVCGKE
jgi:hypothetical protein